MFLYNSVISLNFLVVFVHKKNEITWEQKYGSKTNHKYH